MPELKPCPFCGGQPDYVQKGEFNPVYVIRCWNCLIAFNENVLADVVEKWNTRVGEMKGDEGV